MNSPLGPPPCESVGLTTEPALRGPGGESPDPVWADQEPSFLSSDEGRNGHMLKSPDLD